MDLTHSPASIVSTGMRKPTLIFGGVSILVLIIIPNEPLILFYHQQNLFEIMENYNVSRQKPHPNIALLAVWLMKLALGEGKIGRFFKLTYMQYIVLCVSSLLISLMVTVRMCIRFLIIIIISDIWSIFHCLG